MTRILALILCLTALPATASQPISKSMAQCAGLLFAMEHLVESPDRAYWLGAAAARWTNHATKRAKAEGRPARTIPTEVDASKQDWLGKGATFVFTEDFRDWISYCRKLGKASGLELPKLPQ